MILACLTAILVAGATTSTARADITHNGCTIRDSSVSLYPKPNYSQKPGVGFTIDCLTLTSWSVTTQCRVANQFDLNNWRQCSNTSLVTLSAFNSGGIYVVLVGNGNWGCVPGNVYVGRVEFGSSGIWARSGNEVLC